MKKNLRIFVLGMLMFPLCLFAQTATDQKEYSVYVSWGDLGFGSNINYKVPIYYDDDDKSIKHGPLKINYKEKYVNGNVNAVTAYFVSGNFVNGKINGTLSIERTISGSDSRNQILLKLKGIANFIKGVPCGKWTFSETATVGGKGSQTNTCSITFNEKGELIAYDNKDLKFKINDDKSFSGLVEGDNYVKNVNTSTFVRKTGERTKLGDKEKSLINDFIVGKKTESDLTAVGYVFEKGGCPFVMDNLGVYYYINNLSLGHFDKNFDLHLVPISIYTLKRVNTLSAEQLLDTVRCIYDIREKVYANEIGIEWECKDKNRTVFRYYWGENKIEIDGYDFYFTDETKVKLEELINQFLEEERRIAEEKRLAENKTIAIKALDKLVAVSNVKEMKFWGVDVVLSADYDLRTGGEWDWLIFKGHKTDIIPQLTHFCPMVGYEIISVEFANDSKKDVLVKCLVHKFISKKEGYESYQVNLVVDSRYVDMSKSFNFKQAVKVENDWDKIRSLNSQIEANKTKILGEKDKFLADVTSAYAKYHKSCNLEIGDNTSDCISRLESLVKVQNQCFEFIELRKKINANDVAILGNSVTCKNVVKLYVIYFKALDIAWKSDEKVKDKLNDVIATQDKLIQVLSNENASLLDAAVVEEKIANLQSVFECFETIDLRKQRNENNAAIMAQAKQCKNIVKIYAAYFKKLDFTWTSVEASKANYEAVVANQEVVRKAVESANAEELDKAVKKEKIKNIQALVDRLK